MKNKFIANKRRFPTLDEAKAYAERVHRRTGVFIGISALPERKAKERRA